VLGDTQLLLQSIGSLLLVLAILLAMVFAAKWFAQRRPQGGRRLRFVEAMALGSRDKLLVVEVDGKTLLLGVTAQNIRLLTELDAAPVGASGSNPSINATTNSPVSYFSQLLKRHTPSTQEKDTP